ncbi:Leucine-responsive regulatory protein [Desulfonema limicola]|uniref:Leucine-responsive regulatory protein n=1 Tax=Desulfonema limicola TaxID=45656 RepID=A0A975GIY8_9BACT|nr:Lrp/AsnC family transcriptional regulator [Desulfonema limicola]QTA83052.1 Leucine-responsive regulatory protein [Desulfonema limicola]
MLDEISIKILKILQEKARIPNVEVARQVGMAPSAVLERIRKMEMQGIIDGYEVRLNPEQFNRKQIAFVFINAREKPGELILQNALSEIQEIQEIHFVSGDDCYLVKLRVSDTSELGNLIREKIQSIQGVISTRTAAVLNTFKETARIPVQETDVSGQ